MNSQTDVKSLIESLNHYMDNHLMEMRLSIGAVGLVGAAIALRSIRFATKFYDNKQIPKSFVKKCISLRGVVRSVSTDGTLNVDHLPIISMPWHPKANNDRLLNLSFVAINPSISGTYWLKLNVENKIVWFKAIARQEDDIKCIVSLQKKVLLKKSLNAELVERGLALVEPWDQSLRNNKTYKVLLKNVLTSEKKAQRNNTGIWYKPTKWDSFRSRVDNYLYSVKRLRNVFGF